MRRQVKRAFSPTKAKIWVCSSFPGDGVAKNTRSEAISHFKKLLGVKRLPSDVTVTEYQK